MGRKKKQNLTNDTLYTYIYVQKTIHIRTQTLVVRKQDDAECFETGCKEELQRQLSRQINKVKNKEKQ